MADSSSSLLLNLAILKVNWDQSRDVLHNFMPLVGYAISRLTTDVVSINELKDTIQQTANFRIPTGALESLIRRASRAPYHYVERRERNYHRLAGNIPTANLQSERHSLNQSFTDLFAAYNAFCNKHFTGPADNDASAAFFEFLFEVAPHIARSASNFMTMNEAEDEINESNLRYRAARFITEEFGRASVHAEAIESFVRGAVLAESFYYSSAENVRSKFRDVTVFYDTRLLSQVLGYSSTSEVEKATELHEMVRASQARVRVFEHNLQELMGILNAAVSARKSGTMRSRSPGDIFDYFNMTGSTTSDIELELTRLPGKLKALAIAVADPPPYTPELGIDELLLAETIREEINYLSDGALQTDIASLSAIFRMRLGKQQRFLESCGAIFVTTNSALARASTIFFNEQYGHSDAPICISDHVFCMLVWLKVADKWPDISTDLMVATCYAALQPSQRLWESYMSEADRLRQRGDIVDDDYALLAHSVEARQALMDLTEGDEQIFAVGSAVEVLAAAKLAIMRDAQEEIKSRERRIAQIEDDNARARAAQDEAFNREVQRRVIARERLGKILHYVISGFIFAAILTSSFLVSSVSVREYFSGEFGLQYLMTSRTGAVVMWCALWIFGGFNLVFGWAFVAPSRRMALWLAGRVVV